MRPKLFLENIPKKNIFVAPPRFFEQLPDLIFQKIRKESLTLEDLPKRTIFLVPHLYFDLLEKHILRKTLEKESIRITQLDKERVFEIPKDYFEDLPVLIQNKIREKKGWFVFPAFPKTIQWAGLAASVFFLGWLGSWLFTGNPVKEDLLLNTNENSLTSKRENEKSLEKVKIPEKNEPLKHQNELAANQEKADFQVLVKKSEQEKQVASNQERIPLIETITKKDILDYLKIQSTDDEEMLSALLKSKAGQAVAFGLNEDELKEVILDALNESDYEIEEMFRENE